MNQRKKRSSVDSDETVISEPVKGNDDVFEDDNLSVSDKSSIKTDSSSIQGGYQDDGDLEFRPPRKKRKYVKHVPPPSMIKTRGAKLPKFTFEKRTHRKIAIPSSPQKATVRPHRQASYKHDYTKLKHGEEDTDFVPPKQLEQKRPSVKLPSTGVESTYRVSVYMRYSKTRHLRSLFWTATCLVRSFHEVNLLCISIDFMFITPL